MNFKALAPLLLGTSFLAAQPVGSQDIAPDAVLPETTTAYLASVERGRVTFSGFEDGTISDFIVMPFISSATASTYKESVPARDEAAALLQHIIDTAGPIPVEAIVDRNPVIEAGQEILSSRTKIVGVPALSELAQNAGIDLGAYSPAVVEFAEGTLNSLSEFNIENIDWARENVRTNACAVFAQQDAVSVTASLSGDAITLLEQNGLGRTWTHTVVPFAHQPQLTPGTTYETTVAYLNGDNRDIAVDHATGEKVDASYIPLTVVNAEAPDCRDEKSTRIVARAPAP